MIYFTSDPHFGDPRVLRIDCRPFPDMAAHDAALIANWNEAVSDDDDEVWHPGDFISSRAGDCDQFLAWLHGRKHLVLGNNDPETTTQATGWTSVQHYAEIRTCGEFSPGHGP